MSGDIVQLVSGALKFLRTTVEEREIAKGRRRDLAAAKLCINGISHGRSTHGVLCYRCRLVHRGMAPADADVLIADDHARSEAAHGG